jgi:hypothetical protein
MATFPQQADSRFLENQLALPAKRSHSNKKSKVNPCDLNPYHSTQLLFDLICGLLPER